MKRRLLAAAVLTIVPATALAAKPPHADHGRHGGSHAGSTSHAAHATMWVLHGSLSAFSAPTSGSPGSITIAVLSANHHARALVGHSMTFPLAPSTRIVAAAAGVKDGDRGTLKLRAAKGADMATLLASTPRQVVDEAADDESEASEAQGAENEPADTEAADTQADDSPGAQSGSDG